MITCNRTRIKEVNGAILHQFGWWLTVGEDQQVSPRVVVLFWGACLRVLKNQSHDHHSFARLHYNCHRIHRIQGSVPISNTRIVKFSQSSVSLDLSIV